MATDTLITDYVSPTNQINWLVGTPIDRFLLEGVSWSPGLSGRGWSVHSTTFDISAGTWGSGKAHAFSALQTREDVTPASVVQLTNDVVLWSGSAMDVTQGPAFRIASREQVPTQDPVSVVRYINRSAGLSISEIARLLSVSRRSVHHWLRGGGISADNHERLLELLGAIRPMADTWGPSRTNVWVHSTVGEHPDVENVVDALGRAINEAVRADEIPVLKARRLDQYEATDVAPVTQSELSSALAVFTRPRVVEDRHQWTPREIAWSPPETDDD